MVQALIEANRETRYNLKRYVVKSGLIVMLFMWTKWVFFRFPLPQKEYDQIPAASFLILKKQVQLLHDRQRLTST